MTLHSENKAKSASLSTYLVLSHILHFTASQLSWIMHCGQLTVSLIHSFLVGFEKY
jgi:hypothetical protein